MKPWFTLKQRAYTLVQSRHPGQPPLPQGFTLTELLVTIIIGGIITSTLLWLIVNLLNTSQRESALSETQRDMQRTLDYIAADMKEAVYVYDGSANSKSTSTIPSYYRATNSSLAASGGTAASNFLPDLTGIPVLAFWKTDPVDTSVLPADCTTMTTDALDRECAALKKRRHSYTLVVYTQDVSNSDNTWSGKARIKRYALEKYSNVAALTRNKGYVDPAEAGSGTFETWPYAEAINLQSCTSNCPPGALSRYTSDANLLGTATGTAVTVTDFVDELKPSDITTAPTCPANYDPTPRATTTALLSHTFYACVRDVSGDTGKNQDVLVFLRGNASGRGTFAGTNGPLPVLQTQITMRGVIEK